MVQKAYITVRTQSTQPTKPVLIVDYLPTSGIGAVRRVNTVTHEWDDSRHLTTPGGHKIKCGAGIPNAAHTRVLVLDQGWDKDLPRMNGKIVEDFANEIKGAMSGRSLEMQWTPARQGQHPCGHVQEGDDHFWWEIRTVEVGIDDEPGKVPSGQMYR